VIVDCISDLHGYEIELEGGDLLIVAGDLTVSDQPVQYGRFAAWIDRQKYKKKILIAGNHDNFFQKKGFEAIQEAYSVLNVEYLCDSGCEFEGLKIWGMPWSLWFDGINPHCKAFTGSENKLAKKYELIPNDTDILISHGPSWGCHDTLYRSGERAGSPTLTHWIANHINTLKLFVCGHIHEGYGIHDIRAFQSQTGDPKTTVLVNASYIDQDYEPVNKPIRVIL
jgi:Icc-related predicted phosphoesterase